MKFFFSSTNIQEEKKLYQDTWLCQTHLNEIFFQNMDNNGPYYTISLHIGPFWITLELSGPVVTYSQQFCTIFNCLDTY